MDINDFLERELSDLGLDSAEKKRIEPHFKDSQALSSLIDIKSNLSKGSLEEAEQSYMQLWHLLAKQKLDWNKEVYEQLHSLSIHISGTLSQAYEETKRKRAHIMELISRGRSAMKEGKNDMSQKIFVQVQSIFSSISNVFFEEKKRVQEHIMGYYSEITNANNAELIRKVAILMQEISLLIEKVGLYIKSNDYANASLSYDKCLQLYNQIPEGFLLSKGHAGNQLLDIYKNLSIRMQITHLHKQLGQQSHANLHPYLMPQRKIEHPKPQEQKKTEKESLFIRSMLEKKKEQAKRNINRGFYNEAWKDIKEALQIEPEDVEAKALLAKIKTLQ